MCRPMASDGDIMLEPGSTEPLTDMTAPLNKVTPVFLKPSLLGAKQHVPLSYFN